MARIKTCLKTLFAVAALSALAPALASGGGAMPYKFEPDLGNEASVQRGARNFMNYCSGCHSMRLLRYSRISKDLHIPEDLMQANLMFTSNKPGDHILSAMPEDSASVWFGAPPPDLTVETRYRGADWVYNYILTFYVDPSRPLGSNNLMLPGASMPNVFAELQGLQVMKHEEAPAEGEGHAAHAGPAFELVHKGTMAPEEFEKFAADTVNFMAYAAEPGRAMRLATGKNVMIFLLIFTVLAYLLKRDYWKDVH